MTITVEQARNILGPEYDKISDENIERMVAQIYALSSVLVDWHIKHPGKDLFKKEPKEPEPISNRERHKANKMPIKGTIDDKIKRHIEHVAHCKCRPIPDRIKQEIKKRLEN